MLSINTFVLPPEMLVGAFKSLGDKLFKKDKFIEAEKNYEKALEYYFKALKINEENGHKAGISLCLASIGSLYL